MRVRLLKFLLSLLLPVVVVVAGAHASGVDRAAARPPPPPPLRSTHRRYEPLFRPRAYTLPCRTASRSASSNTMNGALPPSSSDSRFIVDALDAMRCTPTGVEPVKDTLRTTGDLHSASPTATVFAGDAVTMFSTPAGSPAWTPNWASAKAVRGVSGAGLMTVVHPTASAGAA